MCICFSVQLLFDWSLYSVRTGKWSFWIHIWYKRFQMEQFSTSSSTSRCLHWQCVRVYVSSTSSFCGTKPRDITPSIVWSIGVWKEDALDDPVGKDERKPLVSRTNIRTVLKATLGNSERLDGTSFSERIDTVLNWTVVCSVVCVHARSCVYSTVTFHTKGPTSVADISPKSLPGPATSTMNRSGLAVML